MRSTPVSTEAAREVLLELRGFGVEFITPQGLIHAARDIDLEVRRGECLGVVGESGAGKSQVFLGALGLLAANGRARGQARFAGEELLGLGPRELDALRGRHIGLIFQDPMTSLTPHLTIGAQLTEVRRRHLHESARAAQAAALRLLEQVQLSDPARRLTQYPYELSGGMRQRALVALALAAEPQLLIADEPTTALDVTIQAQILALLAALKRSRSLSLILITHDLGAVAGLAERICVLKGGRMVEEGTAQQVLLHPREPYTRALVAAAAASAAPRDAADASAAPVALDVEDLSVAFPLRGGLFRRTRRLQALTEVSFALRRGESLALVGESGCGKSTLARAALQLLPPDSGRVLWLGASLAGLAPQQLRALRKDLQIIFQDPLASLDPRLTAAQSIAEGLKVHARELDRSARELLMFEALDAVGLAPELATRYPHELSGGQCQRVGIARAMILEPRLLVCDEPVSALDVPTQEQIVSLLAQLKRETGLCLIFISHDLALVRALCERVLVMYLGRMMELAPADALYTHPRHPYTHELLRAMPSTDPQVQPQRLTGVRAGEPPSPLHPPSGCVYRTRCPLALPLCAERTPPWEEIRAGHFVACHRWQELPPA